MKKDKKDIDLLNIKNTAVFPTPIPLYIQDAEKILKEMTKA